MAAPVTTDAIAKRVEREGDRHGLGERGIEEGRAGSTVRKDVTRGWDRRDFIKTHQITESKGFCLPFPILFYPKSHRAPRTSAKRAAVSSIPLAPPSRRLRENAHKGTKDTLLVTYTKPCTHVQV